MEGTVPAGEVERRLHAFRAALRVEALDAAMLVQSTDLYYFTGSTQSAHLVVPADGEPVLLVRKTLERARAESPLGRIEPLRSLRDLPGALAAAGVPGGRLGLELDVLPAARYLDYGSRLPGYELADCSALVRRLRAVKSAWELDRIREAGGMLAGVADCVAEALRPGISEIELAAELEAWLRRQGHQGVLRMRGFNGEIHYGTIAAGPQPRSRAAPTRRSSASGRTPSSERARRSRPIGRGEPVIVDLVGSSLGYLCDQTRAFSLGPIADELREAYEHARSIMADVALAAKPGVSGARLYDLALELAGDRRDRFASGTRVSFVGHGFGLEIDEPPFLARGYDVELEPGMVFALEPKFVYEGIGAVGIENSYAVTATGVEVLTTAPEELVEL